MNGVLINYSKKEVLNNQKNVNEKYILIGIGGIGKITMLMALKKLLHIHRNVISDTASIKEMMNAWNIDILSIDTEDSLKPKKDANPYISDIATTLESNYSRDDLIFNLDKLTEEAIEKFKEHYKNYVSKEILEELDDVLAEYPGDVDEGAGQIPLISTILFYNKRSEIKKKIVEMLDNKKENHFIIFNSLAGGTGTGVLMPLVELLLEIKSESEKEYNAEIGAIRSFIVTYNSVGHETDINRSQKGRLNTIGFMTTFIMDFLTEIEKKNNDKEIIEFLNNHRSKGFFPYVVDVSADDVDEVLHEISDFATYLLLRYIDLNSIEVDALKAIDFKEIEHEYLNGGKVKKILYNVGSFGVKGLYYPYEYIKDKFVNHCIDFLTDVFVKDTREIKNYDIEFEYNEISKKRIGEEEYWSYFYLSEDRLKNVAERIFKIENKKLLKSSFYRDIKFPLMSGSMSDIIKYVTKIRKRVFYKRYSDEKQPIMYRKFKFLGKVIERGLNDKVEKMDFTTNRERDVKEWFDRAIKEVDGNAEKAWIYYEILKEHIRDLKKEIEEKRENYRNEVMGINDWARKHKDVRKYDKTYIDIFSKIFMVVEDFFRFIAPVFFKNPSISKEEYSEKRDEYERYLRNWIYYEIMDMLVEEALREAKYVVEKYYFGEDVINILNEVGKLLKKHYYGWYEGGIKVYTGKFDKLYNKFEDWYYSLSYDNKKIFINDRSLDIVEFFDYIKEESKNKSNIAQILKDPLVDFAERMVSRFFREFMTEEFLLNVIFDDNYKDNFSKEKKEYIKKYIQEVKEEIVGYITPDNMSEGFEYIDKVYAFLYSDEERNYNSKIETYINEVKEVNIEKCDFKDRITVVSVKGLNVNIFDLAPLRRLYENFFTSDTEDIDDLILHSYNPVYFVEEKYESLVKKIIEEFIGGFEEQK